MRDAGVDGGDPQKAWLRRFLRHSSMEGELQIE